MKTWTATLNISFSLDEEQIKNPAYRSWMQKTFADLDNPTEKEIRAYFENKLENYAGSNDGSELLANADFDVTMTEE